MDTHSVHWSPLGSMRPCHAVMAPWFQCVPKCQNSLHGSTRPRKVTVIPLVPQGPSVTKDSWFHEVPQSQWSPWICSVTKAPWLHVATLCHNGSWLHEATQFNNGPLVP
ncbi:unnamed protein product [Coccothraustes coccothraustes]